MGKALPSRKVTERKDTGRLGEYPQHTKRNPSQRGMSAPAAPSDRGTTGPRNPAAPNDPGSNGQHGANSNERGS